MGQLSNKAVILSFYEFLLLLYKKEIEGLVLPDEIASLSPGERELKEGFFELITDRYLVPDKEGKYTISSEMESILQLMINASHTFVIYENDSKFPPSFLYRLNLDTVCLQLDERHSGWIRLEVVCFEDKVQDFLDEKKPKMSIQRFMRGQSQPEKNFYVDGEVDNELIDKMLEE